MNEATIRDMRIVASSCANGRPFTIADRSLL